MTNRIGRFGDGQAHDEITRDERVGRFSDGQTPLAGRPRQMVVGRFSTGQERLPESRQHVRVGSFGDVDRAGVVTSSLEATPRELETVGS